MAKSSSFVAHHEGEVDLVVLIKAAPEMGQKHGETVCVAGVDMYGNWHRLYPVPFRDLRPDQKFKRWDRIRVRWRRPSDDNRIESKRIDATSLSIISSVKGEERAEVAARATVQSLEVEMESGRSLALIRPQNVEFVVRRMSVAEYEKSARRRAQLTAQIDLLSPSLMAKEPPPYNFSFRFSHAGRTRLHTCIDWETEAAFFKWRGLYGEEETLRLMRGRWGEEMPAKGLVFAMGTHRVRMFRKWLLSGIIQAPEVRQGSLL